MAADRDRLVALVSRIMSGVHENENDLEREMAEFSAAIPHPRPVALIYYWWEEFDHEPSPDEVVDRALSYRVIEL